MTGKIKECFVRASLDNLELPDAIDALRFSGFFIKKSPNRLRRVIITKTDGSKDTELHSLDEEEFESGFPECEYYLELELGKVDPFDLEEAERKVIWALNRMRLFKAGLLWGALYAVFLSKDSSGSGISEVKRIPREGPYPVNFRPGHRGIFVVKEDEINSIVKFVNDLKDAPINHFAIPLRRFHLYYDRDLIQDGAIDLMVALESMFSDDHEAIGYKIALRVACLTETDSERRAKLFDFLIKAYRERSGIIHGRQNKKTSWLDESTYISTQTNLDSLQEIVRNSLDILLSKAIQGMVLTPTTLDRYLFLGHR